MATVPAPPLEMSFEQFEQQYGNDSRYEYWFGKAVERSLPTIVHGLLQVIIARLLTEAGYVAGAEIELRIISAAHPRPDVIATKGKAHGRYPDKAWEVAVEILSENDRVTNIRDHCKRYQEWGFQHIYLVEPSDRSVVEWRDGAQVPVEKLAEISVNRIWEQLDLEYGG